MNNTKQKILSFDRIFVLVEEDGIRTYGVAISNTLSLNLIALKFIVENKRETDGAAQKPSKKFGLNRSTSVNEKE